jgi:exodeoxyribonuclease-3
MRVIAWNCNMAFRKKAEAVLALKPDILVISECECVEKLKFPAGIEQPSAVLWFGTNPHKGLAIVAYNGIKLSLLDCHRPYLKTIAPIRVTAGDFSFTLIAVWANNPDDPDGQYVEQVWKAIHHYDDLLTSGPVVLAGDFNSNTIWDKKRRIGNHSEVVKHLEDRHIFSAYHLHHGQQQGKEQHPTFYLYRHLEKSYHMDYCFMSEDIAQRLEAVEIGEHAVWSAYSDHVPVIVTFNPPPVTSVDT